MQVLEVNVGQSGKEGRLVVARNSACSTKKQTLGPHVKIDRD